MYGITDYQNTGQKVFFVATKDNTVIKADGTTIKTLNAGEMHSIDISDKSISWYNTKIGAHYIESNHDIYVYQLSGVGHELGSAIVPSIECTGSTSVSFSRIYPGLFSVQIITQKSNIEKFSISSTKSNSTVSLANLKWNWIEGSGPQNDDKTWYAAVANLTNATTNEILTITNSGLFHLSVLDANGASMSYGYFSSFNNLKIDGPSIACLGDDIVLSTTQDPANLTWFYKRDDISAKEEIASAVNSIIATDEGEYWLELDFPGCLATDKLDVKYSKPNFSLGGDVEVCYDKDSPAITLSAVTTPLDAVYEYEWGAPFNNNKTNSLTFTPAPGEVYSFSLTARTTDELQCEYKETAEITVKSIPQVVWNVGTGNNIDICEGDTIYLDNIENNFIYQWYLDGTKIVGETNPIIKPTASGFYEVEITTNEECTVIEGKNITVNPNPIITLDDITKCPGELHTYNLSGFASYLWHDGSKLPNITLYQPEEEVSVTVTTPKGCKASTTAQFSWHNQHVFSFGSDTTVCTGNDITIEIDNQFTNYVWTFNGATIPTTGNNPTANNHILHFTNTKANEHNGNYYIEAKDLINGCDVSGSFALEVLPAVSFELEYDKKDGKICEGDVIQLKAIVDNEKDFIDFKWSYDDGKGSGWQPYGENDNSISVENEGDYRLEATQANGCGASSQTMSVEVNKSPRFTLEGSIVCPGEELFLIAKDYINTSNNPDGEFSKIVWGGAVNGVKIENDVLGEMAVDEEKNYTATVYDKLGCFQTQTAYAGYYDTPAIDIIDYAEFCSAGGFDLSTLIPASFTDNYYWTLDGVKINNEKVYKSGEYMLNVITTDGCNIEMSSITLTALESPTPTLNSDIYICDGEEISIEADRNYKNYQWYFNDNILVNEKTNILTPKESGKYSVIVTAKNTCVSQVSTNVTHFDNPVVDLGEDLELCPGEEAIVTISGNYDKIIWSNGIEDEKSVNLNHGKHQVRVIDSNGCSAIDDIFVSWHPTPDFSLGEDMTICPIDWPVELQVISNTSFKEYIWHSDAIILAQDRIYGNVLDTVNVVKVKDNYDCWYMDTQIISLQSEPNYDFGGDVNECETEVELIAGDIFTTILSEGSETSYVMTYEWLHNNADTQNVLVTQSGEYIVRAFDGCWFKTDTFNVSLFDKPEIVGLDTTFYAQVSVILNPDLGKAPFKYSIDNGYEQNDNTFKKIANGNHTITVEDANGCTTFKDFSLDTNLNISVPNFFTPNNDGYNDNWVIEGIEKFPNSSIRIYDRYGKLLIKYKASDEPWDGTYLNRPIPSDDYWYIIELEEPANKILKGNVTVKR